MILAAVSRELVDEGLAPPFEIRPGLIAEMLALYDLVRRLGRTVDDFERNFRDELEKDRDIDRGAREAPAADRLSGRRVSRYESRAAAANALDEHALRAVLARTPRHDRCGGSSSPWPIASPIPTACGRPTSIC